MKIELVKNQNDGITGFKRILYQPSSGAFVDPLIGLSEISDNECSFIMANEIIDDFEISKITDLIQTLASKLRLNGELVVGGTDIRLFCKNVTNGFFDEVSASELIRTKQSMTSMNAIIKIIESLGLKVTLTKMSIIYYEITCTRN
jgi:hypothetical protein